jgi:type I restriction enzyme S subunit
MSFPRYPAYKPSGVEWLGEVPEHWDTKPLWSLFRRTKRQGYEEEELLSVYRDHGVIPKSSRDDNFNKPSDDLSAYQLVEPGDLTVNKMKAWQGSVAISNYRGIVSPAYHVYSPLHSENSRFLHYLMRCDRYAAAYLSLSKGIRVNQWDLQPEYHSRMAILLPPMEEQATIATFLDHETTKIDALIAEQQRLIELLQEKRQAVISHAVTKGLNPNAPMKDSGVEWLGEVPEHWGVIPLMRLTQPNRPIMYGIVLPGPDVGEGVPILKGGNVKPSRLCLECMARTTPEIEAPFARARLRAGDLVYGIRGSIGDCEIVPIELEACNITQDVARIAPLSSLCQRWLRYAMLSRPVAEGLACGSLGAAVKGINIFDLKRARIPVPPSDEMKHIADFLISEDSRLLNLSLSAETAIGLLQERRSALISAAVTGQIDVRGLVPEASAA